MATGDAVVELDADLEDPPAVIEAFVRQWEDGVQVAYGVRQKSALRPSTFASCSGCTSRFPAAHFLAGYSSNLKRFFRLRWICQVVNVLKHLPLRPHLRGLVVPTVFVDANFHRPAARGSPAR